MIRFLLVGIFLMFFGCGFDKSDHIFYIQDGYVGPVAIVFDVNDGQGEVRNRNGEYIYVVPNSGVLRVKKSIDKGFGNLVFYYVSEKNIQVSRIPVVRRSEDINRESSTVICYNPRIGGSVEKYKTDGSVIVYPPYFDFLIGPMSQIDELSEDRDYFMLKSVRTSY